MGIYLFVETCTMLAARYGAGDFAPEPNKSCILFNFCSISCDLL